VREYFITFQYSLYCVLAKAPSPLVYATRASPYVLLYVRIITHNRICIAWARTWDLLVQILCFFVREKHHLLRYITRLLTPGPVIVHKILNTRRYKREGRFRATSFQSIVCKVVGYLIPISPNLHNWAFEPHIHCFFDIHHQWWGCRPINDPCKYFGHSIWQSVSTTTLVVIGHRLPNRRPSTMVVASASSPSLQWKSRHQAMIWG
jgi:hypothetical protein